MLVDMIIIFLKSAEAAIKLMTFSPNAPTKDKGFMIVLRGNPKLTLIRFWPTY